MADQDGKSSPAHRMGFPEPRMSGGMKLLSSDLQREWKLVISRVGYEWNMEIISYWFENHTPKFYFFEADNSC